MWYKLDDENNAVKCTLEEHSEWIRHNDTRRLLGRTIIQHTFISTVFLGLDHGFGGKPLLFESMLFSDKSEKLSDWQTRYSTFQEAVDGHEQLVREVIKFLDTGESPFFDNET